MRESKSRATHQDMETRPNIQRTLADKERGFKSNTTPLFTCVLINTQDEQTGYQ